MKFSLLFASARTNVPAEYTGTFLDYEQLENLVKLAGLPEGTPVSFQEMKATSGQQLFFMVLDREVARISSHFEARASHIVHSWRAAELGMTNDDTLIPANKLGKAARWCLQYARLNKAALQRICQQYDTALKSSAGADYVQALLAPERRKDVKFNESALYQEVCAIMQLSHCGESGMQQDNSFFDCSMTTVTAPEVGVSINCANCQSLLAHPVGLSCGHVVCKDCVSKALKKRQSAASAGLYGGVLKQSVNVADAACPVCHATGVVQQAMEMRALGTLATLGGSQGDTRDQHQAASASHSTAIPVPHGKKLGRSGQSAAASPAMSTSLGASYTSNSSSAASPHGSSVPKHASLDDKPSGGGIFGSAASKLGKKQMDMWKMGGIL